MKYIKIIIISAIAIVMSLSAGAVTDKEMDKAKAIAIKEYLRWVNNGSGYLDDISVSSMSELNSKLKEKEKENIKAALAVSTPTDYASWDKAKLVEYWSSTFFNASGLDSKGKGAKPRVKKKLEAMTVSAPQPQTESKPKEESAETPKPAESNDLSQTAAETSVPEVTDNAAPTAEEIVNEQQAIADQQQAIEDEIENAGAVRQEEQNNTWVYVLVLAVLVIIVIWLVVYAANLMKRQPEREERDKSKERPSQREESRNALAKKEEENLRLRERLQYEENRCAELGMEIERMKLEQSRLLQQIQQLREQHSAMSAERHQNTSRTEQSMRIPQEPAAYQPMQPQHPETKPEPKPVQAPVVTPKPEPANIIKVIYLGRTNKRGIFVRADRRINPGNTIFRLDTNDGLVGTFHVVDEPEVVRVALSNPTDYLSGGCTGEDLEDTTGVTRIITVSAGTAIFENGYWKVLRKTHIRYE